MTFAHGMDLDFKIENGILIASGNGEYSINQNKNVFELTIELSRKNNISNILLDLRNVTGQCLKFENYELFTYLSQLLNTLKRPIHYAFCANGNILQDTLYANQITESTNNTFLASQDFDQALNWLISPETPSKEKTEQ